ncbi:hypothetical protein E5F05_03875 (plasmid) [Deinococcus metallilatus]|uniref:Uncharacterized protein n=1 Tax=Deinococcus metallilatus TaxID=1211322 RepID=A0AAJ5JZE0_9DEIO|nr:MULTISPECIES: hypothetical protein [Deinococcus]MBB5293933.1 hypothetical protein [Deinococcus metallilatus]QBY07131.1 hypothetical protein E5F05_03875 [Deinococcus metallilatus]RXJ14603.1 hypothetical protein ERJ73_02605 [Deinococcus metallilatus]TLK30723.1 hypothetical protein FCS05_02920 [Deinococcus metallilatus]
MKGSDRHRRAERLCLALSLSNLAVGAVLASGGHLGIGAIFYVLGTVLLAGRLSGWPTPSNDGFLGLMILTLLLNALMLGQGLQWLLAGGAGP